MSTAILSTLMRWSGIDGEADVGAVKVLVVDDDRTVRNVICRALSEEYETVTAENGLDGIEKVQSENPDFVLLDVEMPGLNGYEVCDRLK